MKPLVSVIIPNFNYAEYLREAIDSVLGQTYQNIEIIVVDDGSKDSSADILKSYGNKIKVLFQSNAGVSVARNNGVGKSSGKFIAFLDADDYWLPEKIAAQIELFEQCGEIGLVHVGFEEVNADGKVLNRLLEGHAGWVSHEFLLFERSVVLGGGSGVLIPRVVFDEIDGFDPRLSTCADWDLYYRISKLYQIGFVPRILLRYRLHGSNMHGNIMRMEREVLLGFEKAFAEPNAELQKLKPLAYGNLHRVLAGSYFRSGQYRQFIIHAGQSMWLAPKNLIYFAKFPFRKLKPLIID